MQSEVLVFLLLLDIQQVSAHHYLVKEIPSALVGQGSLPLVAQDGPPGIEEIMLVHVLHLLLGTQIFGHGGVVGIVVHISHHHHAHVRLGFHDAVCHMPHLLSSPVSELAFCCSAGPVAYHEGDVVPCQLALYSQVATGGMGGISILIDIWLEPTLLRSEELWVVEQGAVYTALVGTFYVDILVSSFLHSRLSCEVAQGVVVLHL